MRGAAARADRDDVEDVRAARDRDVDAEGAVGRGGRRGERRRRVRVRVRGRDVDAVPGRGRAGDRHRRAGDGRVVGRARHGQRRRALRARDVARAASIAGRTTFRFASDAGREPDERRRRPRERRRRAGRAAVREADRGDRRVGAERRGRQVGELPVLLRDQPDPGGELAHPVEQRGGAGSVAGREARARRARPTAPARDGRCPGRSAPTAVRRSRGRRSRRRCSGASPGPSPSCDLIVASTTGSDASDVGIGRRQQRRAGRARGSPASITARWSSVGPPLPTLYEIAAFGSPVFESRMKYRGPASGPFVVTVQPLIAPLPVVRDRRARPPPTAVSPFARASSRGGDEAGDLGGDRRRREAALLLPALDAERRPARGEEVRRRLDVVRVERRRRSARAAAPSGSGTPSRRAASRTSPARPCR